MKTEATAEEERIIKSYEEAAAKEEAEAEAKAARIAARRAARRAAATAAATAATAANFRSIISAQNVLSIRSLTKV